MNIERVKKHHIIEILFIFVPIMDMINGYLIRNYEKKGVGLIYHMFFLVILLLLWISEKNIKINKMEMILILLILSAVLSLTVGNIFNIEITSIGIEREIKILSTVLVCVTLFGLMKQGVINHKVIRKIIEYQSSFIILTVFLCDIFGVYNSSYASSQQGRIGLYTNLNEFAIIISFFLFFHIENLFESFSIKRSLLIVISLMCLLYSESKFAIGMVVIASIYIIVKIILADKTRTKKAAVLLSMVVVIFIPIATYLLRDEILAIVNSVVSRQSFLQGAYGTGGFMDYFSSGRTARFDSLIIKPTDSAFCSGNAYIILRQVLVIIFGNGFSSTYGETFEMDLFDIFILNGIFGTIIYIIFNIGIIIYAHKRNIKFGSLMPFLVVLGASILVGHVWTGGVCGMYYGLVVVYTLTIGKDNYESKKI